MTDTAFIADYFSGEKIEAPLFMLVGVAAIALSAWLVRQHSTLRGMAIPLVVAGLVSTMTLGAIVAGGR